MLIWWSCRVLPPGPKSNICSSTCVVYSKILQTIVFERTNKKGHGLKSVSVVTYADMPYGTKPDDITPV